MIIDVFVFLCRGEAGDIGISGGKACIVSPASPLRLNNNYPMDMIRHDHECYKIMFTNRLGNCYHL